MGKVPEFGWILNKCRSEDISRQILQVFGWIDSRPFFPKKLSYGNFTATLPEFGRRREGDRLNVLRVLQLFPNSYGREVQFNAFRSAGR
jgi:hypothetical protein